MDQESVQSNRDDRSAAGGGLPCGLSVVVPCFNSEGTLPNLIEELSAIIHTAGGPAEVILVNDGSRDGTWNVIDRLAREHDFVVGIDLMRNYGQHNATLCGIRAARYDKIVTMDDDLQNPPAEIPRMLEKLEQGFDVVYGVPREPVQSWWRTLSSFLTKRAVALATGQAAVTDLSAFRAFRTRIRDASAAYRSPQIQIDVLLGWGTARITGIEVDWRARTIGRSNYGLLALFNHAALLWTGYTTAPLRLASLVGFAFVLFGAMILAYVVGRFLLEGSVPGFPFLAASIAIFGGVQLFALGIIGEYLARIHDRNLDRPTYVIAGIADAKRKTDA